MSAHACIPYHVVEVGYCGYMQITRPPQADASLGQMLYTQPSGLP